MLADEILILKFLPVDGFAARALFSSAKALISYAFSRSCILLVPRNVISLKQENIHCLS